MFCFEFGYLFTIFSFGFRGCLLDLIGKISTHVCVSGDYFFGGVGGGNFGSKLELLPCEHEVTG